MIKLLIFLSCIFILVCDKNNPVNPAENNLGRITGRVVSKDGVGIYHVLLYLDGTSFNVRTDSTGNYCFYNVPPGKYKLMLDGYTLRSYTDSIIKEISLEAGVIYTVDNISIFEGTGNFSFENIMIFNTKDSIINDNSSNNYSESVFKSSLQNQFIQLKMFKIYEDTVKLQMEIYSKLRVPSLGTDTVLILLNNIIVDTVCPKKGRLRTQNIVLSGMDTLLFLMHGKNELAIILYDTLPRLGNLINISTGKAGLSTLEENNFSRYIIIDSIKYFVSNSSYDSADWDIFFINDSTHDTCYWANPNPDWGVIDNNNDDPQFEGDYQYNYYYDFFYNIDYYYQPDIIRCSQLRNGTYSIYVQMFDALIDSATPTLSLQLGDNDEFPKLSKLIELSPNRNMHKGEVWFAGKLYLPEQTFNSSNQYISLKGRAIARKIVTCKLD